MKNQIFQNMYGRKPNRLQKFDYSKDRLYFVTSCVKNKMRYFGEIRHGEMVHNPFGLIAVEQWKWLLNQYPYLISHAFVVMPDHIHAVLEINRQRMDDEESLKIKSLSQIIGAYKTTVSKKIHLAGGLDFVWQRSFYDRIIRNKFEYKRIVEYIHSNPANWNEHSMDT